MRVPIKKEIVQILPLFLFYLFDQLIKTAEESPYLSTIYYLLQKLLILPLSDYPLSRFLYYGNISTCI